VIADILGKTDIDDLLQSGKVKLDSNGNVTYVDLHGKGLTSLPEGVAAWTSATEIDLSYNKLTSLPEGVKAWTSATEIYLSYNNLTSLPEGVKAWTSATYINLRNNSLTSLPAVPAIAQECEFKVNGTNLQTISIKPKVLRSKLDYFFVAIDIFMGYFDLVSDILAIIQLFANSDTLALAILNICFVAFHVGLEIYITPERSYWVIVSHIFHLHIVSQGVDALRRGEESPVLVVSKKLDAICRSIPSMILQLYSLYLTYSTIDLKGYIIFIVSISCGAMSTAITLSSLNAKSGNRKFSTRFLLLLLYYLAEILMRIITISIMFASIKAIAFAVVGTDFLFRLFVLNGDFPSAIMRLGSDSTTTGDIVEKWMVGSLINVLELFMFLFIINMLDTSDLPTDLSEKKNQKRGLKIHSISIVGKSAKYTKLDVIRLYSYRTCIILHFLKVSLQSALSSLFYQNRCPIPG
jgi:hypothetical protein